MTIFMEHVGVGQKGGLKLRLEAMRTAFREHFFVADKQIIPEAEEFCLDLPCSQIHPGLCAHRDAAIYCKVLQMSKSLEHFVCRRHLDSSGKVYEIQADHNDINPMLVFISHKRSRRLHVQISVVFAGVGCRAGGQLFFGPRRLPDGRFENKFHFQLCGISPTNMLDVELNVWCVGEYNSMPTLFCSLEPPCILCIRCQRFHVLLKR